MSELIEVLQLGEEVEPELPRIRTRCSNQSCRAATSVEAYSRGEWIEVLESRGWLVIEDAEEPILCPRCQS